MKITKLEHSCLLVEMPEPVNRTALFDPGMMSEPYVNVDSLEFLDDIFITHAHGDHISVPLIKKLVGKFPDVRITATPEVVVQLKNEGIESSSQASDGAVIFEAPHESVQPLFPEPQEIGIHYLDLLTDPGDSHTFSETKQILALPIQAPWGSTVDAVKLGLQLNPKYIIPIHDWHWKDDARKQMYENLEQLFAKNDIKFLKMENGKPIVLDV